MCCHGVQLRIMAAVVDSQHCQHRTPPSQLLSRQLDSKGRLTTNIPDIRWQQQRLYLDPAQVWSSTVMFEHEH